MNDSERLRWKICLSGCDDCTTFVMELTWQEAELLRRVAEEANKTSTYVCMPTMEVEGPE